MGDPELDEQLREFLAVAKAEREHTLPKLHEKVDGLHTAVKNLGDNLTAHVQDCVRTRESAQILAASTHKRLVALEGGNGHSMSLPPMRSREESSHELKAVADKVMVAAIQGDKLPNTTPEAMVARVVEEEQRKRDERRRLDELEAAESQRLQDARERRKFWRTILVAAVSGGGALTGAFEALRGIIGHH